MDLETSQNAFVRALLEPDMPPPAGVVSKRGCPDEARFSVYRNNVATGLLKALERRFPVTERLVGRDYFRGIARAYMRAALPESPLMFEYGDSLPDFIACHAANEIVPYLADVARIEAGWTRAYHAQDAVLLSMADVAAIPAEMLAAARLVPHPSACLVASSFPAGSIWAAHQSDSVQPPPHWNAETVIVARPDMMVGVNILPPADATFAKAVFRGETLADAAGAAGASGTEFDFGAALVGLVSLGAFRGATEIS